MNEERKKQIVDLLPVTIRPEVLREAVKANLDSDLGGNKMIYSRVSYSEDYWDGWTGIVGESGKSRRTWAACCMCTACGNSFNAGWISPKNSRGEQRGIAALADTNGYIIDGVPDADTDYDAYGYETRYYDGDSLICPHCGQPGIVTHKSKIRGFWGNQVKYQLLVGSVENLENLTSIIFWNVVRVFGVESSNLYAKPASALIIPDDYLKKGGLLLSRYLSRWENGGEVFAWDTPRAGRADPCQALYYSRERGLKYGAWFDSFNIPDQKGKSGEKTGLIEYLKADGKFPMLYLKAYKDFPKIENLIKSGWTSPIESAFDDGVRAAVNRNAKLKSPYAAICYFNLTAKRPCDMLSMTKEEVKKGAAWKWSDQALLTWYSFVKHGYAVPGDAESLNFYFNIYGVENIREYLDLMLESDKFIALGKIDKYLKKQSERTRPYNPRAGFRYFVDYTRMLNEQCQEAGTIPGPDEIFPRDLRAAHDRLAAVQKAKGVAGFDEIIKKWGGLEYSDDEFCAKLPVCESDLIREGHILHHCVGSYAKRHVDGNLIIFIRRARRPERSYFTLNENLNGEKPRRVQLHGYRNENLPNGKRLTIPGRVLEFVEKWERDVLSPVFKQVRQDEYDAKKRETA